MRVVYNNCYGGFGLSVEARDWLVARSWRFASELGEEWRGTVNVPRRVPRHDPLLADCVEALGERASGESARLAIETVACAYEITDHDGNETVRERYGVEGYTDDDINAARATAERERDEARAELASVRADLAALTARVESVRAQTIAECVAIAERFREHHKAQAARAADVDPPNRIPWELRRSASMAAHEIASALRTLRALATPQPAPVDSLDVDPAAGALR